MGARYEIYRSDYDSELNAFHGKRTVTVVNQRGAWEPGPESPAAVLETGPGGDLVIRPLDRPEIPAGPPPMFGGTFAAGGEARRAPVPVHDRFETWAMYERMSR